MLLHQSKNQMEKLYIASVHNIRAIRQVGAGKDTKELGA